MTNGRTYNYNSTDLRVYDGTTGALHAYYDGDVTAVGFAAGTKVSAVNNTSAWSTRVNVGGDHNFDYVDVQIAADNSIGSFLIWTYEPSGAISGKRWDFATATGAITFGEGTPAYPDKRIQLFDANGNIATSFVANQAYTLRVFLDGESTVHVGTGTTCTLYFGDITYGRSYDLNETTAISQVDGGTFTLPENVSGNVETVIINNVTVYNAATGLGSIDGNVVTADATALAKLTLGENYVMYINTAGGCYITDAVVATDVITTTQELRDLGVGGKVYTDRTPSYNNSKGTVAGAGGNGNSGETGNDVTGYYVLGNDLDFAGENAVAAGYSFQQSWFKATFDGNGHTIFNLSVNEGGIFGSMRNATVKDVNFVSLVYDMSLGLYAGQYSQQTALLAHVCDSSTIENINVHVSNVKTSSFTWATIAYNFWNTNTVTNVNIDASGIALSNVLGKDSQSKVTYNNVTVKAASYATMGQLGNTDLTEWPTGVTFETKTSQIKYHLNDFSNTEVLPYTGDETAFGFNEGTIVYAIEQDNRTSMWNPGTNLGLSMERQALKIYKAADEDYASVQFSVSRDVPGTHAFFAWIGFADDSGVAGGYLYNNGTAVPSTEGSGFNGAYYDAEGNQVTSGLKANTVYTVKWYYPNATVFKIGCAVADGSPITLYFANMSSGNDA